MAPELTGRCPECALLARACQTMIEGSGALVLISGEIGIGKTTLVDWLTRFAGDRRVLALTSASYDLSATPPYGPWIELIDRAATARDLPAPVNVRDSAAMASVRNQPDLFRAICAFFQTISDSMPLLLVVEDIHWADQASLDLLRHAARSVSGQHILIVATYRDDEVTHERPLYSLLPVIARESAPHRLSLRRMDRNDLETLVCGRFRLSDTDRERLTAYVHQLSDGNPFFANEILRALQDAGVLVEADGRWQVGELDRAHIPALARQVIDGRIARLGEQTRRLLELAAVIGPEPSIDLWATIAGEDDQALAAVLEQAVQSRLLVETADGSGVRFSHALVRESLYHGMVSIRRRAWHRTIAETLEARPDADPDQIAHHYRQSGDPRAADWLVAAGERAIRSYAWLTAAERFEAALAFAREPAERAILLYRIGRLRRFSAPQQTIHYLSEAAEVARANDDSILAAYATADLGVALGYSGQYQAALALLAEGTNLINGLPVDHLWSRPGLIDSLSDTLHEMPLSRSDAAMTAMGYVHPRLGTFVAWLAAAGYYRQAVELGEPFITAADAAAPLNVVSDDSLLDALLGIGSAYACLGRLDDATGAYERLQRQYEEREFHAALYIAVSERLRIVTLQYNASDLAERRRLADLLRATRLLAGESLVLDELLPILFIEGDWQAARALADRIVQQPDQTNATLQLDYVGFLERHQGNPDHAWAQVNRLFSDGPDTDPGNTMLYTAVPLAGLAADLCLDAGDLAGARQWIDTQRRYLDWSGAVLWRAEHALLNARFTRLCGDIDTAVSHARSAVARASDPSLPLARVAADRMLGELLAEQGQPGEARDCLERSLTLAIDCAAPFERAQTLLALARLAATDGSRAKSHRHACEGLAIFTTLDARPAAQAAREFLARRSASPRHPQHPAGLTAREVDVLRLVAQGLTDAEVAEQLFMARRTVNTHLTSIYTKLGVNSRVAATRFAVEQGLG